jgi:hypothetical protein
MRLFLSLFHRHSGFKRVTVFSCLVLASVVALAISNEPWKDKDYKSWSNDDVQKILYESPWVKMVEVTGRQRHGRWAIPTPL